jgi:hypothetical protein
VPPRARHLTVSGYFGAEFTATHAPPKAGRSAFFTNNDAVAKGAIDRGWDAILLDGEDFTPTQDLRISSLQSKYVKFLQFRHDFPDLARYDMVTYCDHKVALGDLQLAWLLTHLPPDAAALLRYTPKRKNITREVEVAEDQERYLQTMSATKAWLEELRHTRGITMRTRVANTGIIHCVDLPRLESLFDEVYAAIVQLGQPECQIIWAALAQRHDADIAYIDWWDLAVPWRQPT